MSTKASLSDRMKSYELVSDTRLTRRMPVIIRIDGKAFHTFTRGCDKPFDTILMKCMAETAKALVLEIQGCQLAYTQSDEISLLLTDYETIDTQGWFDYRLEKMCSISASIATLAFNKAISNIVSDYKARVLVQPNESDNRILKFWTGKQFKAMFDSRAYNVPREDICNYFIWRQKDCTRNSIQMVGQANFSHKQLQGKSCDQIQEMLWQEKNINFNNFPIYQKRGTCIYKIGRELTVDYGIPIFTQDRDFIERFVSLERSE